MLSNPQSRDQVEAKSPTSPYAGPKKQIQTRNITSPRNDHKSLLTKQNHIFKKFAGKTLINIYQFHKIKVYNIDYIVRPKEI